MMEYRDREGTLKHVPPTKIDRNPENPRIFFRDEELSTLMSSIRRYGVQVPITVYADDDRYVLIDGERRWRCARKLNLRVIPALVREKPSPLENLLLMFNIHALREQWDYFTIARKLPVIIENYRQEHGEVPREKHLSEITGLTRHQIRRCRNLLDLPDEYQDLLAEELQLPKKLQRLSEDFFIEMEGSLKAVRKRYPEFESRIDTIRDSLISKFRRRTINNVTDFRKVAKMATAAENFDLPRSRVRRALDKVFFEQDTSIEDIFSVDFAHHYDDKRIRSSARSLCNFMQSYLDQGVAWEDLDNEVREALDDLLDLIAAVREGGQDAV